MEVTAADIAGDEESGMKRKLRRAWEMISGKG
jgi:hypothetical protein